MNSKQEWLSNTVFVICTIGFIWALTHNIKKKDKHDTTLPKIEVIDDETSPIDSIVSLSDSTLYFKDGELVGFSRVLHMLQ